jgi:SAM-dependent methyltransferase
MMSTESDRILERYARRADNDRYSPLLASSYMMLQEKERALIQYLVRFSFAPVESKRVLEIGCGTGANLLQLLRLGFRPENLVGNELIEERAAAASARLPSAVRILHGDASELRLPAASFDIVYQSTVFSSILDRKLQARIARRMWEWVRCGGAILWYDFVYDNPNNPDVRGVPLSRVRELFPDGTVHHRRVTLAPPLARVLTRLAPQLYTVANLAPFLRTHVLCWIEKK